MELRVSTNQIPAQAHRLYVQLYCERKGEKDRKTIQEAKKSWASLSLSKRRLFYKTIEQRNLLKFAHGLSNSRIYLKENVTKVNGQKPCEPPHSNGHPRQTEQHETVTSIDDTCLTQIESQTTEGNELINSETELEETVAHETQLINQSQIPEETSIHELNQPNSRNETNLEDGESIESGIRRSLCEDTVPNQFDEMEDALERQSTISSIHRSVPLEEPTPPTVRLGKDLYAVIKRPEFPDWKNLTEAEKKQYTVAVQTIKRDYIKKYKNYLESLSQQQLFNHYIKTL